MSDGVPYQTLAEQAQALVPSGGAPDLGRIAEHFFRLGFENAKRQDEQLAEQAGRTHVPASLDAIEHAVNQAIYDERPATANEQEIREALARRWLGLPRHVTADEVYRWRAVLEQSLDGLAVLSEKDLRSEDHGKARKRIEGVANELFERYVDLLPGRRG